MIFFKHKSHTSSKKPYRKSYKTKEGYIQSFNPKSPNSRKNGYSPVHRDVASKKIGRALKPNEVVHHKDGNKLNNNPRNLKVMKKSKHDKLHHFPWAK